MAKPTNEWLPAVSEAEGHLNLYTTGTTPRWLVTSALL